MSPLFINSAQNSSKLALFCSYIGLNILLKVLCSESFRSFRPFFERGRSRNRNSLQVSLGFCTFTFWNVSWDLDLEIKRMLSFYFLSLARFRRPRVLFVSTDLKQIELCIRSKLLSPVLMFPLFLLLVTLIYFV